jgi:hypothetical protein
MPASVKRFSAAAQTKKADPAGRPFVWFIRVLTIQTAEIS